MKRIIARLAIAAALVAVPAAGPAVISTTAAGHPSVTSAQPTLDVGAGDGDSPWG